MIVLEGWDASGKGGTIRRLLKNIDPRFFDVYGIAKPTQEELDHHYLQRFWDKLPAKGQIAVFDRSWYGRVLVERIEGFASDSAWRRAYKEINDFEKQLVDDGFLLLKFFMHISSDEQRQRFEARAANPLKRWKLGPEDYRNRKKWRQYEVAIDDMFDRTHTPWAPWRIVAANDKHFARIDVQRACLAAWSARLDRDKR